MTNQINLSNEVVDTINNLKNPEVINALEILAKYNLGASMPHIHGGNGNVNLLPKDMIQYEEDQKVTFMKFSEKDQNKGFPVGWRMVDGEVQACAWCHDWSPDPQI